MWELDNLTDAELLTAARDRDINAVDELFRRHYPSAVRFAQRLAGSASADDRAAEAFSRVYRALLSGSGPDDNFRSYLLSAVKNVHVDTQRKRVAELPVEDPGDETAFGDTEDAALATIGADPVRRAFARLSPAWRTVLWYTIVLGETHAQVAERLGTSVNAVGVLSFRAREGLRQAYLAEHVDASLDPECREMAALLPGYVRGQIGARSRRRVTAHLAAGCRWCEEAIDDLTRINENLGSLLTPVLVPALPAWGVAAKGLAGGAKSGTVLAKALGGAAATTGTVLVTAALVTGTPSDPPAVPPPGVSSPAPSQVSRTVVAAPTVRPSPSPSPTPMPSGAPSTTSTAPVTAIPTAEPSTPPTSPAPQTSAPSGPSASVSPARVSVGGSDQARAASITVTVEPGGTPSIDLRLSNVARVEVVSGGRSTCPALTTSAGTLDARCTVSRPDGDAFTLTIQVAFADPAARVDGTITLVGGDRPASTAFVAD
ncbi:sigma-70 family RNA polymerase sigma factor [Nocardioides stalactiti]|uniref:sigma-70 family RNA polymerase sigma factor n=1 Tax=Nocardioides stalactiti TaxID=2755356 RepID=UPI0016029EDD|nr:RNA polymerase sigma factor [Nocardioides stalactiti]